MDYQDFLSSSTSVFSVAQSRQACNFMCSISSMDCPNWYLALLMQWGWILYLVQLEPIIWMWGCYWKLWLVPSAADKLTSTRYRDQLICPLQDLYWMPIHLLKHQMLGTWLSDRLPLPSWTYLVTQSRGMVLWSPEVFRNLGPPSVWVSSLYCFPWDKCVQPHSLVFRTIVKTSLWRYFCCC